MRYASIIALVIWCIFSGASDAAEERRWGLAVSSCGGSKRIDFGIFERDGELLVAEAAYTNFVEKGGPPKKTEIRGHRLPDGSFWPTAALQVSDEPDGPWRTLGHSSRRGVARSMIVHRDRTLRVHFDLSPFLPMLGTRQFGRVVISTGEYAMIAFSFIKP